MPTATLTPTRATGAAVDPLVVAAEGLIVRGKEHGELPADDIIGAFPDLELEPDALERLFDSFRQMGIAIAGEGDRERRRGGGHTGARRRQHRRLPR